MQRVWPLIRTIALLTIPALTSACGVRGGNETAAPSTAAHKATPQPEVAAEVRLFPLYTEIEELRTGAQAVVDDFHARTLAAGLDRGPAPTVEVRAAPQIIFFVPSANEIVVPWWDDFPPELWQLFTHFAGGDEAEGVRIFHAFFHRFFIAHEASHWLHGHRGDLMPELLYPNENTANRTAVAYWRTQPDGEPFLAALERMIDDIVARIPDPTPPGRDPAEYFGANYQELGADGVRYGYYQFRFVRDALRERERLDFDVILADLASPVSASLRFDFGGAPGEPGELPDGFAVHDRTAATVALVDNPTVRAAVAWLEARPECRAP